MALVPRPQSNLSIADIDDGGKASKPSNYFTRFLTSITDALNGTEGVAAPGINQVVLGIGSKISNGGGPPNGVVVGDPGDLYLNTFGGVGATLWVKESGTGTNIGWIGK